MTRVKKEKAGGLYGKIKNTAHIVPTRRRNIGKKAAKKAPSTRQGITKRGKKRRQSGISAAKKKTSFLMLKKSLDLVEKLGDLRERGMLSEKEFQAKKKEILEGNLKWTSLSRPLK